MSTLKDLPVPLASGAGRDPDQAPSSSDSDEDDGRPKRRTHGDEGDSSKLNARAHAMPSSAEMKRSTSERSLPVISLGQMKFTGAQSRRNLL